MELPVGPFLEYHPTYLDNLKHNDPKAYAMTKQLLAKLDDVQHAIMQSEDNVSGCLMRMTLYERIKQLNMLPRPRGFVLVLVAADTDKFVFRNTFLNWHEAGGRLAAEELSTRVKDYMKTLELNPHHTDVVVRVYADMKSLEVALSENGRMTNLEGLSPFVHGFNQDKSLFDFIDVGGSQECIEKKTWECLNLFLNDLMCKHIVLGVRQDLSEGSYLRRLFAHNSNRVRTTLLSDGPINPEMMTLRLREPLELDTVFESSHGSDPPGVSTPLYPLI